MVCGLYIFCFDGVKYIWLIFLSGNGGVNVSHNDLKSQAEFGGNGTGFHKHLILPRFTHCIAFQIFFVFVFNCDDDLAS